MDRTPFDFDLTASRDAFGDDDMLRFVDEWVRRFDDPGNPADAQRRPAAHAFGPRGRF